MAEAYPLHWPVGWPRTDRWRRESGRFQAKMAASRQHLMDEIRRMGGRYPVLSTNVELRRDGLPYANQREPDDPGVAVYFEYDGKQMVFACDRWRTVAANVRAIGKSIEAIRGIERWGASDMMERAFAAFEALPPPGEEKPPSCWSVLDITPAADVQAIEAAYRHAARKAHPDAGGSDAAMSRVNWARDQALKIAKGDAA